MRFIYLGTGSAFCQKNYQTNIMIEHNSKYLLIDAGGDIRWSLAEMGFSYKGIDSVYITHAHQDHCGGLEGLAFCSYFDPTKEKIGLIANSELMRDLWNSSLSGGLRSIQGKKTNLMDFFDVTSVHKNGKFIWEDIQFDIVQSVHIMDGYSIVPSYGLMIHSPTGALIYYTGDTQFNPNQIMDFYKKADFIIQDCETSPFKSGVHANYTELKTLPSEIKAKMALVHYQDNVLKDRSVINEEWENKAKEDGFNIGFIPQGSIRIDYC